MTPISHPWRHYSTEGWITLVGGPQDGERIEVLSANRPSELVFYRPDATSEYYYLLRGTTESGWLYEYAGVRIVRGLTEADLDAQARRVGLIP